MRTLRTLRSEAVQGKKVLVRVDCNVAVDETGQPFSAGSQRLVAVLPTLELLRASGARVILLSHLGRPAGRVVEALRLDDISRQLGLLLRHPVQYAPDIVGSQAREAVDALKPGDMLMLENLRFVRGEEQADPSFARALAGIGEYVVQDAFADAHREHASVALLPTLLPSCAGLLVEKEVTVLQGVMERPERPLVVILGGAKLETKLGLIRNLLPRVDHVLTGGGIANSLLQLFGYRPGVHLVGEVSAGDAEALLNTYRDKIHLPRDLRVRRAGATESTLVTAEQMQATDAVFDLGPETVADYCALLQRARTCVWNGPLGKFEEPEFAFATRAVAQCVTSADNFAVVGGGDTVRAVEQIGCADKFDHVSTGGGAMLAFLEGAPMPGLEPLYVE